ncbi:hypothetical protein ABB26_14800 [Stenotrophomonas humi]|uniref:TonB C-terminal domain-containing protein n=1 Tax=Stenotrophomonas humi TaxID=405444 RepID=A0A0R0C0H1_9GAMM|nr:energy transducer TonB [Stenotrophomonas humi]KRG62939.1 hypothetical protein ABB26_14800 [Stenotrophomonas humi]
MKSAKLILMVVCSVGACVWLSQQSRAADVPGITQDAGRGYEIAVPNGTPVNAGAYNQMIVAQGHEHYCGSGKCDRLPELVSGSAPTYPPELIAADITGSATLVFTIDEQGSVVDARVESATRPEFSDASLEAVRTWKFTPATLSGKPIRMETRQQFPFELR